MTMVRPMPLLQVGRPCLPPAETLLTHLRRIDEARWYTNRGPLIQTFEARLAKHFQIASAPPCMWRRCLLHDRAYPGAESGGRPAARRLLAAELDLCCHCLRSVCRGAHRSLCRYQTGQLVDRSSPAGGITDPRSNRICGPADGAPARVGDQFRSVAASRCRPRLGGRRRRGRLFRLRASGAGAASHQPACHERPRHW